MLRDNRNNYTQMALDYMTDINNEMRFWANKMLDDEFTIEEISYMFMTEIASMTTKLNIEKSIKNNE